MALVTFVRSPRGRLFGVLAGFTVIVYGAMQVSLAGLILMMVGIAPAVMGLAGSFLYASSHARRPCLVRTCRTRRRLKCSI